MKESLTLTFSESMGTWTARSCGYKASSTQSRHFAAQRLIEKIYDYIPADLKLDQTDRGTWIATWTEPKKEAA